MSKDKCVIGEYCSDHGFIHGGEAEELRSHIEACILARPDDPIRDLQAVLDRVDARDSLAYLERIASAIRALVGSYRLAAKRLSEKTGNKLLDRERQGQVEVFSRVVNDLEKALREGTEGR